MSDRKMRYAFIAADKNSLTADELAFINLVGQFGFNIETIFDDANIDNGIAELDNFDGVFLLSGTAGLVDDLNKLTTPIITIKGALAAHLRMGTASSPFAGTSITITDASSEMTSRFGTGALTVYTSSTTREGLTSLPAGVNSLETNGIVSVAEQGARATDGGSGQTRYFAGRRIFIGLPIGSALTTFGKRLFQKALNLLVGSTTKTGVFPVNDTLNTATANPDTFIFTAPADGVLDYDWSLQNIQTGDDFNFKREKFINGAYVQLGDLQVNSVPDEKRISGSRERMNAGDELRWTVTKNSATDRQFPLDVLFKIGG